MRGCLRASGRDEQGRGSLPGPQATGTSKKQQQHAENKRPRPPTRAARTCCEPGMIRGQIPTDSTPLSFLGWEEQSAFLSSPSPPQCPLHTLRSICRAFCLRRSIWFQASS